MTREGGCRGGGVWTKCTVKMLVVNTLVMGAMIGDHDAMLSYFWFIIDVDNTSTIHLEWNICNAFSQLKQRLAQISTV